MVCPGEIMCNVLKASVIADLSHAHSSGLNVKPGGVRIVTSGSCAELLTGTGEFRKMVGVPV